MSSSKALNGGAILLLIGGLAVAMFNLFFGGMVFGLGVALLGLVRVRAARGESRAKQSIGWMFVPCGAFVAMYSVFWAMSL
jgi:hypothetical protein